MKTRISISIDEKLKKFAEDEAKRKGIGVSHIISMMLAEAKEKRENNFN